jgi:hypothetical protein
VWRVDWWSVCGARGGLGWVSLGESVRVLQGGCVDVGCVVGWVGGVNWCLVR